MTTTECSQATHKTWAPTASNTASTVPSFPVSVHASVRSEQSHAAPARTLSTESSKETSVSSVDSVASTKLLILDWSTSMSVRNRSVLWTSGFKSRTFFWSGGTLNVRKLTGFLRAVSSQICVTRDNVNIEVDSVLCWHVVNPYRAAFGIADVRQALVERAQTTLRQVVGARVLQNVLTDREGLAAEIQEIVEGPAEKWGVNIESILLKDLRFSEELQQSLSSAATRECFAHSKGQG